MRIDEATDVATLERIDAELSGLGLDWARPLRFKVGQRKVWLKRQSAPSASAKPAFAASYALPAADGRPLYRYRLRDDAFGRLQENLQQRAGLAELEQGHWPGLFTLWAAEWFRRCYRGGGHRWADLINALGMAEDQARLRQITAAGLRAWKRPVLTAGSAREFLGSLAREGGFPIAAIEDGARGWAQDVLKAIVAPMLGDAAAGEERARELAAGQRLRLPQLFRDDEFIALCADLALAVVQLRRDADGPAAAAGLPVAAWLELHQPDWRERLPLSMHERAGEALLSGLMTVEAISGGSVGVERLLVRDGAGWREAVRITLDGAVDSATMRAIEPTEGRLRAFAAGEMARALPGELAMFDPPADKGEPWMARSTRRARGVQPVPFAAPIELDLRAGERNVCRIAMPGGKPRRGALLVGVLDEGTIEQPQGLRIVGAGSGQYREQTVFLQVPADWQVSATVEEAVESLGSGVTGTCLWRVSGGAFITDDVGDCYRVRCDQPGEQTNRIDLIGTAPAWAEVSGSVDVYVGSPLARTSRNEGSLCIRNIGERSWRPAPRPLPVGHYEIGWRSERILLDRRRIAVLPSHASLVQSGSLSQPFYQLSGWGDGCAIEPAADAPVDVIDGGKRWRGRRTSSAVHWFGAKIRWKGQPDLPLRINHPCSASIARWTGEILPDRTRLTLSDLRDLVAINRGSVTLVGELVDRGKRRLGEMVWQVDHELPMASIAADLASLLLPASIDAEVRLGMHDGIETYWHVRQFAVELQKVPGGIVASRGVVAEDVELVGRAIAQPSVEVAFGAYSLLTDANHRPAALPTSLRGDWLLYLRSGETVLSRPLFVRGEAAVSLPRSAIALAMTNPPGHLLDRALKDVLNNALAEVASAEGVVEDLLTLISSLHGLPPATFRVLELLPDHPALLARLALTAPQDVREQVIALADALPFAWCTLSRTCWQEAQAQLFGRNLQALAALGHEAPRYAKQVVDDVVQKLTDREPLLRPVLLAGDAEPIAAVAQAFMNRAADRISPSSGNRYRSRLRERLPPYFHGRFDDRFIDTLDAPCAAALAVADIFAPNADDIRHIKTVARTFPTYFADAFAATLQEL